MSKPGYESSLEMTMIPYPTVLITMLIALIFLPKDNQAAGELPPNCNDVRNVGLIYLQSNFHVDMPADRQLLHTGCNTFQPEFAKKIRSYFLLPGVGAACEFYDDENCKKKLLWVAEDRSDKTVYDNEAQSAKCGIDHCDHDYQGTVFEDRIFEGASQNMDTGKTNIDRSSWKTGVTSYIVFPGKWCYFYALDNCVGNFMRITPHFKARRPLRQNEWIGFGDNYTKCTKCELRCVLFTVLFESFSMSY